MAKQSTKIPKEHEDFSYIAIDSDIDGVGDTYSTLKDLEEVSEEWAREKLYWEQADEPGNHDAEITIYLYKLIEVQQWTSGGPVCEKTKV